MDSRNPVGQGVVARPEHRLDRYVHNFEYPEGEPEKAGPAGFGAIASFWSPRRELSGTYDQAWDNGRRPLLPIDWDPHSSLCAPVDQRPGHHLHGGEFVELINLTRGGVLRFLLPKVYLVFRTYLGRTAEEHRGHLSTVVIEPDYPRVIMVWATSLLCRENVDYLEKTIVREKAIV
jgi:hypothetical protein